MHEILKIGHPQLRKIATAVDDVTHPQVQKLIDDLLSIVIPVNGVGIAAPQINHSQRVIVVASHPNIRYPYAPEMEATPMINPRILHHSDDFLDGEEGCLSVPQQRGNVLRWRALEVEFYDRQGARQQREYDGFIARIVQHEIDHLNGILFVDHQV